MLEGPVKARLFGRFVSGTEQLRELCHRMRKEGQKRFTISRVAEGESAEEEGES